MQMTKKVLSIVLAVMMVVSMMSVMAVTANAATTVAQIGDAEYTTLASAITAAQNGDTIKLVDDVTEAVSITGKTLTLDLNGYNITSPSATQPIKVYGGTKLTIDNSNVAKSENTKTQNAILGSNGGANNYGSLFADGANTTVDINAGYYYGYNGDKAAIHAVNNATVTFYDCVVNGAEPYAATGTAGKEGKVFYSGVGNPTQPNAMDPGYIVVHGGTFSGRMSDSNWGNYVIDGGTFDRNVVVINENPVDENGNRVATASGNMTKIADGTIEEAGWPANGYMIVKNANNTYGVAGSYAAKIGETGYATLAAAIAAAQNGDTVKLLDNVTEAVSISGKELTLDLNGYNITSPSATQPIRALNAAKLTITNSNVAKSENTPTQNAILGRNANGYGSLLAKDGSTVDIKAGYYYGYTGNKTAIHAYNGATITFYDCVVNGAEAIPGDPTTGKEGKVFYSGLENPMKPNDTYPGTIIVHGGTFNGRMSDSNWGNYEIYGGTFDRNSVVLNENPVDENGNRVATADGSMATLPNSPGTIEEAGWPADGYMIVKNANNTYGVDGPYAAKIGETGYATLAAAIAAAQNGDTVKLLTDQTIDLQVDAGQEFTIDLNSYTLTVDSSQNYNYIRGELTIDDSSSAKDGKVIVNDYGIAPRGDSGKLTVNSGTFTTANNYPYLIYLMGGELEVNGGSFTAEHPVNCYSDGNIAFGGTVVINGGEFTSTGYFVVSGFENSDITINGGEFEGPYPLYVDKTSNLTSGFTPASATITGGTFTATEKDGYGETIVDCENGASVTITGGTFTGGEIYTDGNSDISVSGGTFSEPVPADYCANGYIPTDDGNGNYGVKTGSYVAQVGTTKYETFAEAVAAANGSLIKILAKDSTPYVMSVGQTIVTDNYTKITIQAPEGAYAINRAYDSTAKTYTFTVIDAIASLTVGGTTTYYSSLNSAVSAAPNSSATPAEVNLLRDSTELAINVGTATAKKNVVIDLGDNTLTLNRNYQSLFIIRNGSTAVVKNGEVVFDTVYNNAQGFLVYDNTSSLTLAADLDVEATGNTAGVYMKNGTLNSAADITAENSFAICTNGSETKNVTINVTGGNLTSDTVAVYLPGDATATLTDANVTGATAVYVKSGDVTINGGTYTANGAAADYTYNGNGANATGDAIVVDSCGYPGGAPEVTISGSPTIASTNGKQIGDYAYGNNDLAEVTATSNTMTLPEGLKWVETATAGVYEVAEKTLQDNADTAVDGGITGLSFVDSNITENFTNAFKASLLGVQLRKNNVEYEDTYGSNDLRYVAAVEKTFLAGLDDYGFAFSKNGTTYTEVSCKGTENTVITAGQDDDYTYFTAALKNISDTNQKLYVKFFVKDGNDTAYAKYTKVNPQDEHQIIASYDDVAALAH